MNNQTAISNSTSTAKGGRGQAKLPRNGQDEVCSPPIPKNQQNFIIDATNDATITKKSINLKPIKKKIFCKLFPCLLNNRKAFTQQQKKKKIQTTTTTTIKTIFNPQIRKTNTKLQKNYVLFFFLIKTAFIRFTGLNSKIFS